ncbi:mucin-5AC [Teleopsis dalmanni]|uniref:mucin-5AC n=1 Tax=Teleopsis dalmanni TaxID=139649 RepID=UPI0018CE8A6E|nr:mucin-5AC [Teleopsis dalmanni]
MFWRFTSILALALLLGVVPAQLDAFVTQSTGCHHNGTWYADKSLVPTTEKCLNCQCNKKTLTCRLKVCPEMPMPPPRGCVVVQKKNTCCPYLSCARLDAFYNIPNTRRIIAYLNHYERESIDRVVNENVLQRRSDDSEVDLYVCVKNGTVYKSGSAMSSSNLCTYCYCIGGTEKCVKPKCMLPVEGCKPIFVDSTCCPVRYDCSTKTFGKSSQEVNYRKTSNKHFLRMSQRLQRNRGCTVNKQFYAEGQKMKSDPDKPCDICFCIRGNRRCAPKKCSPALKNCIPVVPKGQCCPSSYDCGSQRDYRRAQNSRQFNFLSLLFGKDEGIESNSTEISVQYPHDRQPPEINENNVPIVSTTSERSIFDTIREGLEFIDGNNNQMLTDNIDLLGIQTAMSSPKIETSTPSSTSFSSTTEVSFLDLLLGPTDDLNGVVNNLDAAMPQLKTTTKYPGLSWVDLLLGSDEDDNKNNLGTTNTDTMDATEATTFFHSKEDTTNIDRMDEDFDDFSGSGELLITDIPVTTESIEKFSTVAETNLVKTSTEAIKLFEKNVADNTVLSTEESTTELPKIKPQAVKISITPEPKVTTVDTTMKTTMKPSPQETTNIPFRGNKTHTTKITHTKPNEQLHKTDYLPIEEAPPKYMEAQLNIPEKKNNLLTAFFDGISDILGDLPSGNATNTTLSPADMAITLPTPRPLPLFKPLPPVKSHTRINSKIANLTAQTPIFVMKHAQNITIKPIPIQLGTTTTATTTTTRKTTATPIITTTIATTASRTTVSSLTPNANTITTKSTKTTQKLPTTVPISITTTSLMDATTKQSNIVRTTDKPLIIKTNPTILEAEPLDKNAEPTLPPSLPNLKIIPFLPTDAVKADRGKLHYDYYHNNPQTTKIDYELYDDANLYPAITERYPTYTDLDDSNKAEYIYKFDVEGPTEIEPVPLPAPTKLEEGITGTASFVKYDFDNTALQTKGFSPPTKTEGGFVPKNPLIIDENEQRNEDELRLKNSYQVTKHIIDITTADPANNTTKVIEITTPDPFKDVIRTETPPDLSSLIEDKEKNSILKHNIELQNIKTFSTSTTVKPFINKTTHVDTLLPSPYPRPKNTSDFEEIVKDERNSIESFFNLFFNADEDDEHDGNKFVGSSTIATVPNATIPPFKSLPASTVNNLAINWTTKRPSSTTTIRIRTTTVAPTTEVTTAKVKTTNSTVVAQGNPNNRRRTTTPKPVRQKNTHTPSAATRIKNKTKVNNRNQNFATNTTAIRTGETNANATKSKITHPLRYRVSPTTTTRTTIVTTTTSEPITTTLNTLKQNKYDTQNKTRTPPNSNSNAPPTTTLHPYLMSPFDKLPFMDASVEVKSHSITTSTAPKAQHPSANANTNTNLLGLVHYKNKLNKFEGLEPAYETSVVNKHNRVVSAPQVAAMSPASISSVASSASTNVVVSPSSNSLIDSAGILKLAGCNIYGRMYRVGRIILELSNPCLECRCTEVGVKCGPLDC